MVAPGSNEHRISSRSAVVQQENRPQNASRLKRYVCELLFAFCANNVLQGMRLRMKHTVRMRPTRVPLMLLSAFCAAAIVTLVGCHNARDVRTSSQFDLTSKRHAEVSFPDVSLHGDQAMDWVAVKEAKLEFTSKGGPLLVGLLPQAQPVSAVPAISGLFFYVPTSGSSNRWLISIVRDDSFEVAVFDAGHSTHNDLPGFSFRLRC